jgi:ABC-type bacteriocin/lantibiotic exporter with double-glycine peptidase domain
MSKEVTKIVLPIKGVKQKALHCGPCVVSMILRYYGIRQTQEEIGKAMNIKRQGGTYPSQLMKYLERYGVHAKKVGSLKLEKYMAHPRTAIIGFKQHFCLIVGRINSHAVVIDPNTGRKSIVRADYFKNVKDYIKIMGVTYEG